MARIANDNSGAFEGQSDNIVQPFQLELSGLRGRLIKLGSTLDEIISAHDYPPLVAYLLSEGLALGLLISSMLKYDGVFTLQTSTDGAVSMLVVDVTSKGVLRGYAAFDEEQIKALSDEIEDVDDAEKRAALYSRLMGKGHLAFTVDQPGQKDRYQGIVALEGDHFAQSVQHYFDQSEQVQTFIRASVGRIDGQWRAGLLMLQKMPEEGGSKTKANDINDDAQNIVNIDPRTISDDDLEVRKEDWNRSITLLETCTENEFLDPELHSNDLLFRLFHEEGVRVYDRAFIKKGCRCSSERVTTILSSLSEEDIKDCIKNGVIEMICEFCSRRYVFDPETLSPIEDEKDVE